MNLKSLNNKEEYIAILKMTMDKFGRHLSQPLDLSDDEGEDFNIMSTSIVEDIVKDLYYNVILTFESTIFQENSKKYLISNVKTCHVSFYESAMIENVIGYPTDIVTIINEKEFTMAELINVQLRRGDNISFRERDPQSTNSNLFLELFLRVPVGLNT